MRKIILFFTLLVLSSLFAPFFTASANDDVICKQYKVPVTLSASDSAKYNVSGWLCGVGDLKNKTIQLTIPGATYSHIYWDFPYQNDFYSYTKLVNKAGYATFNIDRIGSGESSLQASPEAITTQSTAYTIHQIVQKLKAGDIGKVAFKKVILVGHSMGSNISIEEAGTYQDVDGVILTGHIHNVNPAATTVASHDIYPAAFDPKFAALNLPVGYLTTVPNTRKDLFYYTPTKGLPAYDSTILATDESTKDMITDGVFSTFFETFLTHTSNNIHVPVFITIGQNDFLYCPNGQCTKDFVKTNEAPYYDPTACPEYQIVPYTGHDINLHYSHPLMYLSALDWANRRVGREANKPAPKPCGQ